MLVYTLTHRRGRTAFAVLAAAALAGLVLLLPAPASAATPNCFDVDFQQACVFSGSNTFTDTVLCDFPVQVHATDVTRYRPVFATDGSGALVGETFFVRGGATIVNEATGRFFTDGSTITRRRTFLPDGTIQLRETGLFHNARTDVGQLLFHQSGTHTATLDPDEQVIPGTEVFHGNFQLEAAFPAKVCPVLAQPA
jgi:hypothetical protein